MLPSAKPDIIRAVNILPSCAFFRSGPGRRTRVADNEFRRQRQMDRRRARRSTQLFDQQLGRTSTLFGQIPFDCGDGWRGAPDDVGVAHTRSEEHTSELQSLMRISYAVFCLKKKRNI